MTGYDWLRPVLQKTGLNWSRTALRPCWTGPGLSLCLKRQKTRLDRTFEHYFDGEEGVCAGVIGCGLVLHLSIVTSRLESKKVRNKLVHKNKK
jgi:hypothetical protein